MIRFPCVVWRLVLQYMITIDPYDLVYNHARRWYERMCKTRELKAFTYIHKLPAPYFRNHYTRTTTDSMFEEIENRYFYWRGFVKNGILWSYYDNDGRRLRFAITAGMFKKIHSRARWKNQEGRVLRSIDEILKTSRKRKIDMCNEDNDV